MKLKIPALLSLLLVFSSVIYASNQEGDIIILAEGYVGKKEGNDKSERNTYSDNFCPFRKGGSVYPFTLVISARHRR